MIRNHAPLVAAEQAAMLSALYRGSTSGWAGPVARSRGRMRIRRTVVDYDGFEDDVQETVHHLDGLGRRRAGLRPGVLPRHGGLRRARRLGLAVAGHIARGLDGAVAAYQDASVPFRSCDRPSDHPYVMLCLPVLVADSDDEAAVVASSPAALPGPVAHRGSRCADEVDLDWSTGERYRVDGMLEAALVGSADTVRGQLLDVVRRLAPDEVMAMTDLPDPEVTMSSRTAGWPRSRRVSP